MARILESRHFIVSQFRVNERWNLANPRRGVNCPDHTCGQPDTGYILPFGDSTGLIHVLAEGLGGGASQIQFGAKLTF